MWAHLRAPAHAREQANVGRLIGLFAVPTIWVLLVVAMAVLRPERTDVGRYLGRQATHLPHTGQDASPYSPPDEAPLDDLDRQRRLDRHFITCPRVDSHPANRDGD